MDAFDVVHHLADHEVAGGGAQVGVGQVGGDAVHRLQDAQGLANGQAEGFVQVAMQADGDPVLRRLGEGLVQRAQHRAALRGRQQADPPKFVAAGVPYITPESGDDDVFRAFSAGGFVWRTLESDSTQLWFMLADAKQQAQAMNKPKPTVALVTANGAYGSTFFDWFGFHAIELGLTPVPPVAYDQDMETCESYVARAVTGGAPDFLIGVPSGADPIGQARCIVEEIGPDPASGFTEAYMARTGSSPPDHSPNAYDAIALLAYGLEKAGGKGRKALDAGMRAVVDGAGPKTAWNAQGIAQALALIRQGQQPDITGASRALGGGAGCSRRRHHGLQRPFAHLGASHDDSGWGQRSQPAAGAPQRRKTTTCTCCRSATGAKTARTSGWTKAR